MNRVSHCCEDMKAFISSGEVAIRFVGKFREYGIAYLDGGTSYQLIVFCPWCGSRLPSSLRQEWFTAVEERGLEPGNKNIPEEFLTDLWYSNDKSP